MKSSTHRRSICAIHPPSHFWTIGCYYFRMCMLMREGCNTLASFLKVLVLKKSAITVGFKCAASLQEIVAPVREVPSYTTFTMPIYINCAKELPTCEVLLLHHVKSLYLTSCRKKDGEKLQPPTCMTSLLSVCPSTLICIRQELFSMHIHKFNSIPQLLLH